MDEADRRRIEDQAHRHTEKARELAEQIFPLLADASMGDDGQDYPEVIGGALAQIVSRWSVGFRPDLRHENLETWMKLVRKLLAVEDDPWRKQ